MENRNDIFLNIRAEEPGRMQNVPEKVCKKVKELGGSGFALTQYGTFAATDEWISAADNCRLKMIPGLMGDIQPGEGYIVLLCRDKDGQKAVTAASQIWQEEEMGRCIFSWETLSEFFGPGSRAHGSVYALTGGEEGFLYRAYKKEEEKAREILSKLRDVFGEDALFFQLPGYQNSEWAAYVEAMLPLCEELQISAAAANDVCMAEGGEDEILQQQLLMSHSAGAFKAPLKKDGRTLCTEEELAKSLSSMGLPVSKIQEAMENSRWIYESCKGMETLPGTHYAKYMPGKDAGEILVSALDAGIKRRFPQGMPEMYKKRLSYEMSVIKRMHYEDYFIIVADYVRYARILSKVPEERIPEAPITITGLKKWIGENRFPPVGYGVGPSRGSAGASLVCMLLGITMVDPVKEDLDFDRFLNVSRVTMPDIDVDLSTKIRGKVIEYIKNRYGEKAVCAITTKNRYGIKSGLEEAARLLVFEKSVGKTVGEKEREKISDLAGKITRAVPFHCRSFSDPVTNPSGKYENEGGMKFPLPLKTYLSGIFPSSDGRKLVRYASCLEGCLTGYGTHPAGIVISDVPDIGKELPLRKAYGMPACWCGQEQVEERGFLKMDLLSSRALSMMDSAVRRIWQLTGKVVDPDRFPEDDRNVFSMLSRGETAGIFQLEGDGITKLSQKLRPESMQDLELLISLYRPGPMQAADSIAAAKNGDRKPVLPQDPRLEAITRNTYGNLVYQEQVLAILKEIAGYSGSQADTVRKYISKKEEVKLKKELPCFVMGCQKNGIGKKAAVALFKQMEEFASYAFNKAHAAGYARQAYCMAYLKLHYPECFAAAALKWLPSEAQKKKARKEAVLKWLLARGTEILAPDINESGIFPEAYDGFLQLGLKNAAGASGVAGAICRERDKGGVYVSVWDLLERTKIPYEAFKSLIEAGALDSFCSNRVALLVSAPNLYEASAQVMKCREAVDRAESRRELEKARNALSRALWRKWQEVIPIKVTDPFCGPCELAVKEYRQLGVSCRYGLLDGLSGVAVPSMSGKQERFTCCLTDMKIVQSKRGTPVAFSTLLIKGGQSIPAAFFESSCVQWVKEHASLFFPAATVQGRARTYKGRTEFVVEKLSTAEKAAENGAVHLHLTTTYGLFHILKERQFRDKYESSVSGSRKLIFCEPSGRELTASYRVALDTENEIII